MKYYKVKPQHDNTLRSDGSIYVANELYTEREVKKLNLNRNFLDVVEESKRNVYWFFGARFAKIKEV